MAKIPLWQDIVWQVLGYSQLQYEVFTSGGSLLYSGLAVANPNDGNEINIRLNDIFADALYDRDITFSSASGIAASESGRGVASFVVRNMSNYQTTQFDIVADYSYNPYRAFASDPIIPIVDGRQDLLLTSWEGSLDVYKGNNSVISRSGAYTYCIGSDTLADASYISASHRGGGSFRWDVRFTCADYVLHYINARGGWDSLLMLGKCSAGEEYTRHAVGRRYDNSTGTNHNNLGKVTFANEVSKKWTLRTGFLTDEQSAKMYNVLGTTRAILQDLNTNKRYPVAVTNSSYEEQTYRGNGNKMAQYEINVELAQQHIRR